ncbi:hypothetical protein IE53DRAFT_232620 [Violaceomyces palustris]|uniref:Uncharacterized protein n=1 Tax=Violaceomyces palustris TaxID=1673888 RepID=A0ACD0P4G2_9BASI|nr:hypothetical protein IE53DRAFT_232620 [Violaceomyces palustris]
MTGRKGSKLNGVLNEESRMGDGNCSDDYEWMVGGRSSNRRLVEAYMITHRVIRFPVVARFVSKLVCVRVLSFDFLGAGTFHQTYRIDLEGQKSLLARFNSLQIPLFNDGVTEEEKLEELKSGVATCDYINRYMDFSFEVPKPIYYSFTGNAGDEHAGRPFAIFSFLSGRTERFLRSTLEQKKVAYLDIARIQAEIASKPLLGPLKGSLKVPAKAGKISYGEGEALEAPIDPSRNPHFVVKIPQHGFDQETIRPLTQDGERNRDLKAGIARTSLRARWRWMINLRVKQLCESFRASPCKEGSADDALSEAFFESFESAFLSEDAGRRLNYYGGKEYSLALPTQVALAKGLIELYHMLTTFLCHDDPHNLYFQHGDVEARNVVLDEAGRAVGLIDWDRATLSHLPLIFEDPIQTKKESRSSSLFVESAQWMYKATCLESVATREEFEKGDLIFSNGGNGRRLRESSLAFRLHHYSECLENSILTSTSRSTAQAKWEKMCDRVSGEEEGDLKGSRIKRGPENGIIAYINTEDASFVRIPEDSCLPRGHVCNKHTGLKLALPSRPESFFDLSIKFDQILWLRRRGSDDRYVGERHDRESSVWVNRTRASLSSSLFCSTSANSAELGRPKKFLLGSRRRASMIELDTTSASRWMK